MGGELPTEHGSFMRRVQPLVPVAALGVVFLLSAPSFVGALAAQAPGVPSGERQELPSEAPVFEIPALQVDVSPPAPTGKMHGFYERMERGFGTFITRGEIEDRSPDRVSDLFHAVAGVRIERRGDGTGRSGVTMARSAAFQDGGRCAIHYWVDGSRIPIASRFDVDELSPGDVEGIEVYRGPSEIPARFTRFGDACGVVVVWTRDPRSAVEGSPTEPR